jgi:restriction endonuclease S subunit
MDSTYFQKEGLSVEAALLRHGSADVVALSSSILSFGAYALTNQVQYRDRGIPFLRCADIKSGFVSFGDVLKIDNEAHELLYKSRVDPETVLLTMSGTVGSAAVALPEWQYPINSNQDIAKIRAKGVSPYYLAAFFGSQFGRAQIVRLPVGSVQQHIFLSMIETLKVARLRGDTENAIADITRRAYLVREDARRIMEETRNILLNAVGLQNWSPPEPLTYTETASAAVAAARLDANYFAPRYKSIVEFLLEKGSTRTLSEIASVILRGRQPNYGEAGLRVVNSKHVRTNRVLCDEDNRKAQPTALRVMDGDVLINGTGVGTIGRAAPFIGLGQGLPDNHVTIVRQTEMDPLYLSVFLNSIAGQLQIEQRISGSSGQIELYPVDIGKIVVWIAPRPIQDAVASSLRASYEVERRATELLKTAKRAVEIAIEQDEAAALRFISEQGEGTNAGSA